MGILRQAQATFSLSMMLGIILLRRTPRAMINVVSIPFTLVFITYVIGGSHYIIYGVTGGIIMTLVHSGLALGSTAASNRLDFKFQDFVVGSPVRPFSYMFGLALAELLFSLPALIVLFGIFSLVEGPSAYSLSLIMGVFLTWISASSLGFFLSTHFLHAKEAWSTISLLERLLTVVPPVFYSIAILPSQLQALTLFIPTTQLAV